MACDRERVDGMTASAPAFAMLARKRSESKPLSANSLSNDRPLIRSSAWRMSFTLPAVRMKRTGLPSASTLALIFVLRPPRERPIASSSLPLLRPPHAGAPGRWWSRDQVFKVWIFEQRIENTLPSALLGPSAKALEHAVPLAELIRQVSPGRSRARQPKHRIDE